MQALIFKFLLLLLLSTTNLFAQQTNCYNIYVDSANSWHNKMPISSKNYGEAVRCLEIARACAVVGSEEEKTADTMLITAQKRFANELEEERRVAERLKEQAQKALANTKAFQDVFYFYYGKWALVYLQQEGKYTYISPEGRHITGKERHYTKLEPFNYLGLAKAERDGKEFYLDTDTSNNEHRITKELSELSDSTTCLDLSAKGLSEIPAEVFKHKQLRILLLSGNQITNIPDAIGNLKELTVLSLGENLITTIPDAIGNLKKLKRINLSDNPIETLPKALAGLPKLEHISGSSRLMAILKAISNRPIKTD